MSAHSKPNVNPADFYGAVPDTLSANAKVTDYAVRLYAVMKSRAGERGWFYNTLPELAVMTGKAAGSRKTVRNGIACLVKANAIRVEATRKENGDNGTAKYFILGWGGIDADVDEISSVMSNSPTQLDRGTVPNQVGDPTQMDTASLYPPHTLPDIAKCNTADAESRDKQSTHRLPEQSLNSPNDTAKDLKTPLRERNIKWVRDANYEALSREDQQQQDLLRAWRSRSDSVEDRLTAMSAYLYGVGAVEAEELMWDSGGGTGSEFPAMTMLRCMIVGSAGFVAMTDYQIKRTLDEAFIVGAMDVEYFTWPDVTDVVPVADGVCGGDILRRLDAGKPLWGATPKSATTAPADPWGTRAPLPVPDPSVGRTAAYAGGPVEPW